MDYQITNKLTPTNPDGSIDQRYSDSTKRLLDKLGTNGVNAIDALRNGQLALATEHGWVGRLIVDFFYEEADRIDRTEDHLHRWKSKRYLKQLQPILELNGFTSSQATKLIKSKQFRLRLSRESISGKRLKVTVLKQIEFYDSYGVSGQYELSLMNEEGLRKAMKLSKVNQSLPTIRALEEIKRDHPRRIGKGKEKQNNIPVVPDDTPSSTEIVIAGTTEQTQYDLAKELVAIASLIETKDGWKDPELIEILSQEANQLMSLAHIAMEPVTQPITV